MKNKKNTDETIDLPLSAVIEGMGIRFYIYRVDHSTDNLKVNNIIVVITHSVQVYFQGFTP